MTHQLSVTLSDAEYQALAREAAKNGTSAEALAHEMLARRLRPENASGSSLALDRLRVMAALRQVGLLDEAPEIEQAPGVPADAAQREAMREVLAERLGQGTPLSRLVIEGRE